MASPVFAKRDSLSQQARNLILGKIAANELRPGQRVVEARIADELGISAIPVREAIRELVAIRVLEYSVHKGARVRAESVSATVDALRVKGALEALAVRLSGGRCTGQLAQLRSYAEALFAAARDKNWAEYQSQNQLFHETIVKASGNEILIRLWLSLAFDVRTLLITDILTTDDPFQHHAEHQAILEAIEQGDTEKAAATLSDHATGLADRLLAQTGLGVSPPNSPPDSLP